MSCLDQFNGSLSAGFLVVFVEVVDVLFVDGADCHHHDLDLWTSSEVSHLTELGRVIEEIVEGHPGIEGLEVSLGHLDRLVHTLFDSDRRHHDHELGETIALVKLEDRTQIDVGFAGTRLHFHCEITRYQGTGSRQAVAELDAI